MDNEYFLEGLSMHRETLCNERPMGERKTLRLLPCNHGTVLKFDMYWQDMHSPNSSDLLKFSSAYGFTLTLWGIPFLMQWFYERHKAANGINGLSFCIMKKSKQNPASLTTCV